MPLSFLCLIRYTEKDCLSSFVYIDIHNIIKYRSYITLNNIIKLSFIPKAKIQETVTIDSNLCIQQAASHCVLIHRLEGRLLVYKCITPCLLLTQYSATILLSNSFGSLPPLLTSAVRLLETLEWCHFINFSNNINFETLEPIECLFWLLNFISIESRFCSVLYEIVFVCFVNKVVCICIIVCVLFLRIYSVRNTYVLYKYYPSRFTNVDLCETNYSPNCYFNLKI